MRHDDVVFSQARVSMRRVAFLVLPEFSHLGLAAALEPLFVANWLAQHALFAWTVVSIDGRPVRASNGRICEVDGDLAGAEGCQTVFVLASFDPQRVTAERTTLRWLKRLARFGTELGGIENGSLVLAAAGLLDGQPVAVHWDNAIGFQERYPKTRALCQLFVRGPNRITCAGAAAILDLMVAWIGWHAEQPLAMEVADHLLLGGPRPADAAQRGTSGELGSAADSAVARARALMAQHIEEPLSCADLAARVGMSLRQIERRFKEALRSSVSQQYRQIRMAKAHQLLQQTPLSVTEVGLACGFASTEYFCRLYRRQFGCSPSHDRRQSTTAPVLRRQGMNHV
jgi:AraC family carnitine catabolism transcriptional activator